MNKVSLHKVLLDLSKEDLIQRILFLTAKRESQADKLFELEKVIIKKNNKLKTLKTPSKTTLNHNHKKSIINHYEELIRDYRLEISDLKDEIKMWKIRYQNK